MCELLVMASDNRHSNPIKDRVSCWKSGMILLAKEDGFKWGREELNPPDLGGKFFRIKLIGTSVAEVSKYLEEDQGVDGRRRAFRIMVGVLPVGMRNTLMVRGFYETSWLSLRNYIENIKTQRVETGVVL